MSKLAIGIPTINRSDLLQESLHDLSKNCSDINNLFIIDNGKQNIKVPENISLNTMVYTPPNNLGVAGSWNKICDIAFNVFDYDKVMILNDDIVLGKDKKSILKIYDKYPYDLIVWNIFCVFVISKKCYEIVGKFDENFYPAYLEDTDYLYRTHLAVPRVTYWGNIPELAPSILREESSSSKNPSLSLPFHRKDLEKYYIKK